MANEKLQAKLGRTREELAESKRTMRELGKMWPKIYFKIFKDLVIRNTDKYGKVNWDRVEKSLSGGGFMV
jgi:hypothetical protein